VPLDALFPAFRSEWILYEDDDVIVVDKPAGLSTHAPEPDREDDVHSRLLHYMRERGDAAPYLGIHQRLDRDTSGVLLFTKRKEANRAMAEQFEGRLVEKAYVACAEGLRGAPGQAMALRHKVAPDKDGLMRALPPSARGGKEAVAKLRVVERVKGRALVELRPETGRTHQLRVQLAAERAPIACDTEYGGPVAPRLLLHATELGVRLPKSAPARSGSGGSGSGGSGSGGSGSGGKKIPLQVFQSPVPDVFRAWLKGEGPVAPLPSDASALEALMRDAADRRYGLARLRSGAADALPLTPSSDPPKSSKTTAFRIVNGAGDGLPGVTIDVYGEHLVVALSSDEATAARDPILDAAARLGAAGVYLKIRPKHASVVVDTRRDDLAPSHALRGETAPDSFCIYELGLPFEVRLGDGLSTGIFLDQRENRRRVRAMSAGKRVLNLFAYTGAFSVVAAAGGARATATVDVSRGALAWARRNLDAIGAPASSHELIEADALPWLTDAARSAPRFDLAILDPPSFATTKTSRFSAESGYRELAALVYRVLAPGGKLLACTNHRGIVRAKLRRYLHEAARDAGREVVQMKDMPDATDFPPEPGLEPFMKSVLVTLDERESGRGSGHK
jgi:23S rRNA (cytosine1962-C5)-methyltransferase